jgi:hypothetical protein
LDELTVKLIRRLIRLRSRFILSIFAGGFVIGWIYPDQTLPDHVALVSSLAAWIVIAWAAADRVSNIMRSLLAGPLSRRSWMVAYLIVSSVMSAATCFLCYAMHGFRIGIGVALLGWVYGWLIGQIGFCLILVSDRPNETICIGAAFLVLTILTAPVPHATATALLERWHPFALYKYGLFHASFIASRELPPFQWGSGWEGFVLLMLVSLTGWRWCLRSLDRLETLPYEGG